MHFFAFLTDTKGTNKDKQGLGHTVALPLFTLKSMVRQKNNYRKFKIFHHANL
jgi:hypothetical protein